MQATNVPPLRRLPKTAFANNQHDKFQRRHVDLGQFCRQLLINRADLRLRTLSTLRWSLGV